MTKKSSIQEILQSQITIPSKLLTSFKSLDVNEKELVVILQLHRFLMNFIYFPTPAELEIGRASCRERVWIMGREGSVNQKDVEKHERTETSQLSTICSGS